MTTVSQSPRLPGPKPLPMLGETGQLLQFFRDPVGVSTTLHRTYGPIAGLVENSTATVFVLGPRYNHQLLTDQDLFHSSSQVVFPAPEDSAVRRLDSGLVMLNGQKHRDHRRLILPAFHRKQVESYATTMQRITESALDQWQLGQERDMAQAMQQITLRIATTTLFGLEHDHEADQVGRMVKQWIRLLFAPGVLAFPFDLPGSPRRRVMTHADHMERFYRSLIAQKRAHGDGQDVLSTLLAAHDEDGERLTDAELVGHANVLFIAGHETSANALTWTLLLLALHPHILADLHSELTDAPLSTQRLMAAPLLDQVVKESLRLFPPFSFSIRVSQHPFDLGGYAFPAQMRVLYNPYLTHRLPDIYPNPLRFDPRRWESITPSAYEYVPFGAGPRMCIGASFATLEMKIVLAAIIRRFRLMLRPGHVLNRGPGLLLTPRGGLPMTVVRQDRRFSTVPVGGQIHEMVDLEA